MLVATLSWLKQLQGSQHGIVVEQSWVEGGGGANPSPAPLLYLCLLLEERVFSDKQATLRVFPVGEVVVLTLLQFLFNYFQVSSEDIQEYLSSLMDQEFNTLIEDGSLELVSSIVKIKCTFVTCQFAGI